MEEKDIVMTEVTEETTQQPAWEVVPDTVDMETVEERLEDVEEALEEMRYRGSQYPGGSCGLWGACGAAVSSGMYMSIITKANPLTVKSWQQCNQLTSRALGAIAELGGPRCCKRNTFTAVQEAVEYTKEALGIEMEIPEEIICTFSSENKQCKKKSCPYHRA